MLSLIDMFHVHISKCGRGSIQDSKNMFPVILKSSHPPLQIHRTSAMFHELRESIQKHVLSSFGNAIAWIYQWDPSLGSPTILCSTIFCKQLLLLRVCSSQQVFILQVPVVKISHQSSSAGCWGPLLTDFMSCHHWQYRRSLHSHGVSLGSTLYTRSTAPTWRGAKGSAKASCQAASTVFLYPSINPSVLHLVYNAVIHSWALKAHKNCAQYSFIYALVGFHPKQKPGRPPLWTPVLTERGENGGPPRPTPSRRGRNWAQVGLRWKTQGKSVSWSRYTCEWT